MVEEDVVKGRTTPNSVPEPDGWSTRCDARGHEETQVLVAMEGQV